MIILFEAWCVYLSLRAAFFFPLHVLLSAPSWTPMEGQYHGFLITHDESIALAEFLTVRPSS